MKNFIVAIFIILGFCQLANAATSNDSSLTTCEQAEMQNKPMVVMYSADYCFYCKQFKPVFYHLSHNLSNEYNFIIHDITKKHQPTICNGVDLDSIPSIFIINPQTGEKQFISEKYYSSPIALKNVLTEYYKNLK